MTAVSARLDLGDAGVNLVVATAGTSSTISFSATAVNPGSGAVDAVYTLVFVDGRPASERAVNGSLTLTSRGRFTAISQLTCCGNTSYRRTGQYAIAAPKMLFDVETGDWKPGLLIGDMSTPQMLVISFFVDGADYLSSSVYQSKP